MPTVQTVTGPVELSRLGPTLMHEHIFSLYAEVRLQDSTWDEEERVADAVAKVRAAYSAGVRTVVDLTVYGIGRNVGRVARVARESGMNIVAATGVYFFAELPSYFRQRATFEGPAFIEDLLVREIETGIFDTGIRAALIKCASDHQGTTEDVEFNLRATARAQLRTGVPISTHTHAASRSGLEQQRVFREEGVDLGRVIIGHCGDTGDLDYLQRLLDAGSYLGMDRFGHHSFSSLGERVRTLATLCERGYADRLVLSHDTNCWSDKIPDRLRDRRPDTSPARLSYISEIVLPELLAAGVSQSAIDQMLIGNPAEVFGHRG